MPCTRIASSVYAKTEDVSASEYFALARLVLQNWGVVSPSIVEEVLVFWCEFCKASCTLIMQCTIVTLIVFFGTRSDIASVCVPVII